MTTTTDTVTRFLGRCPQCKAKNTVDWADYPTEFYHQCDEMNIRCRNCASPLGRSVFNQLRGRFSDTRCSARCTSAVGFDCECSCGGRDHGIDNLA